MRKSTFLVEMVEKNIQECSDGIFPCQKKKSDTKKKKLTKAVTGNIPLRFL